MEALPYYPIGQFYKRTFGEKVYKISVAVADTCPNREGLRGMKTCNFCDQWGSAAYHKNLSRPLKEQIESVAEMLRRKRHAEKFIVYFQAYTTTFSKVKKLNDEMNFALTFPGVIGLVVGTRPDCLSDALFDAFNEKARSTFMGVELGVQSFDNKQLEWMRRGHTAEQSLKAIDRLHKNCPQVNLGAHLMFGLPGETDQDIIDCAKTINGLPIHNVKLHHLHVLKGTALAYDFLNGDFQVMEKEDYFRHVRLFLSHLNPGVAVHRLAALAPRWDELMAPAWTAHRMEIYQEILDYMREHDAYQGQFFEAISGKEA